MTEPGTPTSTATTTVRVHLLGGDVLEDKWDGDAAYVISTVTHEIEAEVPLVIVRDGETVIVPVGAITRVAVDTPTNVR